jgi:hypothetical protein
MVNLKLDAPLFLVENMHAFPFFNLLPGAGVVVDPGIAMGDVIPQEVVLLALRRK